MPPDLVVIGTSLGGLRALGAVLGPIPPDFPLAITIVQHRGKSQNDGLCAVLQTSSALPVAEPEDKEAMVPGRVYVAPPDYHLLVARGSFALSTEPPVRSARPSIDVLFDSAADAYRGAALGVILTGLGQDGADGAASIKRHGGTLIVEDPNTAEAGDMPRAARAATAPDHVVPLDRIASLLVGLCLAARG